MRVRLFVALGCAVVVVTAGAMVAAQAATGNSRSSTIHIVLRPEGGHAQLLDFEHDGLNFGDRLVTRGVIADPDSGSRVGTAYGDCVVVSPKIGADGTYWCRYVLDIPQGQITTEGLDPHGPSDVLFSITGGTRAYKEAAGHAEYVDSETQTDIYLILKSSSGD